MSELKTKIKERRLAMNLHQDELAEIVGVRRETLWRLEKGIYNPSLKLGMELAKALHTTVEDLFEFTED